MANILPPSDILDTEPEKFYTIGFDDKEANAAPQSKADVLQRKDLGKKLSNIVEISTEMLGSYFIYISPALLLCLL